MTDALFAGKGIADQDRNILSNQVMLLGFLQSAAPLLSTGPIPVVHVAKKKKSEDDESGDEDAPGKSQELANAPAPRGTVLITLRNVPPYTLW